MGGMFPSTQTAVVSLPWVTELNTDVAGGAVTVTTFDTPSTFKATIVDGNGVQLYNGQADALPAGVSLQYSSQFASVAFDSAYLVGKNAGLWTVQFDKNGNVSIGTFQWGGLADLIVQMSTQVDDLTTDMAVIKPQIAAINTQTQPGGTMFNNTNATRKALVNRWEVTDTTNPAAPVITVYEDDDVTPIGSRSVRNGDASNVSLAQVLNVGKVT